MAQIHFTRGKAYVLAPNCDDNPTEYVESEGERLIKQMVQKQMNTQVSLEQQLQKPKEFETCMEFVPLTKYTSGQISFADFKDFTKKITHVEDLKSSGLTEKEIDFLNDYEKGEQYFEDKYKKVEVTALKASLEVIYKKLNQKSEELADKQSSSSCERGISRHELELGLSVKPESDHTKLLQFALSCQPGRNTDSRPLNHPIHSLKKIEYELFNHLKTSVSQAKKRKFNHSFDKKSSPPRDSSSSFCVESRETSTLWDSHETPKPHKKEIAMKEKRTVHKYTCAPKPLYTVRDGKIVSIEEKTDDVRNKEDESIIIKGEPYIVVNSSKKSPGKLIPLHSIQDKRISIDDILKSPHFKNYEKGNPSQILYVKNISNGVKEEDLVSYFGHFETPGEKRITYRLMTGRMRGQAFITFPSIEKATQALESLNGCECKGKPLVIQFGRAKS